MISKIVMTVYKYMNENNRTSYKNYSFGKWNLVCLSDCKSLDLRPESIKKKLYTIRKSDPMDLEIFTGK